MQQLPTPILTSDFPSAANSALDDRLRRLGVDLVVAWLCPIEAEGRVRFTKVESKFRPYGCGRLILCALDEILPHINGMRLHFLMPCDGIRRECRTT